MFDAMHHVEIKRRMAEADIAAISVLLEAASVADGHRALGEHQWLDLVQGGREGFAGFVARETGRERVVAYAQISRGNDGSWAVEYVVHPQMAGVGCRHLQRDLLSTALGEIAAQGGGHVHLWVPKPTPIDDAVARRSGCAAGATSSRCGAPCPSPDEKASIPVRPFRPGVDESAWLEVNNRAFRGHPEQGSWDLATLVERESQPWFDPRRVPSARDRRSSRRLLLDQGPRARGRRHERGHRAGARRDLRDRRRSRLPGAWTRAPARSGRAGVALRTGA